MHAAAAAEVLADGEADGDALADAEAEADAGGEAEADGLASAEALVEAPGAGEQATASAATIRSDVAPLAIRAMAIECIRVTSFLGNAHGASVAAAP